MLNKLIKTLMWSGCSNLSFSWWKNIWHIQLSITHCQKVQCILLKWSSEHFFIIGTYTYKKSQENVSCYVLLKYLLPLKVPGPHFLCWILGVVPFNMRPISSWEENKCCYKLSKCKKWHPFTKKWLSENSCHFCQFLLSL